MSEIDAGGFVYPIVLEVESGDSIVTHGITRRNECADKIAASIASGLAMDKVYDEDLVIQWLARISYKLADAMILESKKDDEK